MKKFLAKRIVKLPAIVSAVVAALALGSCAASSTDEKPADETAAETGFPGQVNHYKNYADYTAAGTTIDLQDPDSLRAKEPWDGKTMFVIFGVNMKSPEFRNGDFMWAGDVAKYGTLESELNGLSLPMTGAVVTFRKGTILMLDPEADKFVIDGQDADRARFDALTGDSIQRVTLEGRKVVIETKLVPEADENIDVKKATDDEARLMRRTYGPELLKLEAEKERVDSAIQELD